MITNVCIAGRVAGFANDFTRYVEVERVAPDSHYNIITDLIPVAHFSKSSQNQFMRLKEGAFIIAKGRLEMIEGIGLSVVIEVFELLSHGVAKTILEEE